VPTRCSRLERVIYLVKPSYYGLIEVEEEEGEDRQKEANRGSLQTRDDKGRGEARS
jgi:hypothetical protein